MKALVCGSFDPITLGHLDIIKRAASLFDSVDAVIFDNGEKKCLFSGEKRLEMLTRSCRSIKNVETHISSDFLTDYCEENGISVIVRGIRDAKDADYETELSQIYRNLSPNIETVILSAKAEYRHISSTFVKELIKYKKNLEGSVPSEAIELINNTN